VGLVDTNILLETGTNELEILEFVISGNSYGINVAKITELMQIQEVQEMPLSHPCVEGVFQPRNGSTLLSILLNISVLASRNIPRRIFSLSRISIR